MQYKWSKGHKIQQKLVLLVCVKWNLKSEKKAIFKRSLWFIKSIKEHLKFQWMCLLLLYAVTFIICLSHVSHYPVAI